MPDRRRRDRQAGHLALSFVPLLAGCPGAPVPRDAAADTPAAIDARDDEGVPDAPADAASMSDVPSTPDAASDGPVTADGAPDASPSGPRVLVFSATRAFRHDAIPAGVAALRELAGARGWTLDATEDPAVFNAADLARYRAVVWLLTSGDVLDPAAQSAFEGYIRAGGGYVGVHSASDTEYDWPFYGRLVGAYFSRHPPGVFAAALDVVDPGHPSVAGLGARWMHADEWYTFRADPALDPAVHVILTLDEDSFAEDPAFRMGHHPASWYHYVEGGRAFYTALGHTAESYAEPTFRTHLAAAVEWAAGAAEPRMVLEEFNSVSPNGAWDMHQYAGTFAYEVGRDALHMVDRAMGNQHLTRRGITVDPSRQYAIEALFTVQTTLLGGGDSPINSFCLNLNVQGAAGSEADLAHLYTHSINVDIASAASGGAVMKYMGFVDGGFAQIGQRTTACCARDREYRLRADVNTGLDGARRPHVVRVTVSGGPAVLERFEVDYSTFPWQPDPTRPARVGVNTHDTDWLLRDLRVFYLD